MFEWLLEDPILLYLLGLLAGVFGLYLESLRQYGDLT